MPENQAKLYYLVTTFNNEQDSGKRPSLSAYAENNHIAYKTIQPYCCKNVHERKKIEFKQQSLLDENEITSVCQYVIRENLSLDDPPLILDKLQSQYGNKLLDRKSARNQFYRYIKPKCEQLLRAASTQQSTGAPAASQPSALAQPGQQNRLVVHIPSSSRKTFSSVEYARHPRSQQSMEQLFPHVSDSWILVHIGQYNYDMLLSALVLKTVPISNGNVYISQVLMTYTLPLLCRERVMSYLSVEDCYPADLDVESITALSKFKVKCIAKAIQTKASRILDTPSPTPFAQLLYFQNMKHNKHNLRWGQSNKEAYRDHLSVWGDVISESILPLTSEGIYVQNKLSAKPHGTFPFNELISHLQRAQRDGIPIHYYSTNVPRLIGPDMAVMRLGSAEIEHAAVRNFRSVRDLLFDYMMGGNDMVASDRHESAATADAGLSQPQPLSNLKRFHEGRNGRFVMPHVKQQGLEFFQDMPAELRDAMGDLLVHIQRVTKNIHPDAMCDDVRSSMFSPIMQEHFPNHPNICIEYLNLIIKSESGGVLYNHMDYLNDTRKGYSYCSVYWYLYERGGVTYRVCLVTAFRFYCGKAVEKL